MRTEDRAGEPVESVLEAALAGLWAHVLQVPVVDRADDFAELGGDTGSATVLLADVLDVFGVDLPATTPFEGGATVAGMAQLLHDRPRLLGQARDADDAPDGPAIALLPAQEGAWFLDALTDRREADNAVIALRLRGPLDVPALATAFADLVARHDALRAVFPAGPGGPPEVVVHPAAGGELVVEDAADLDAALAVVAELVGARLDLVAGPVHRARLLRLGPHDHVLVLVTHRVVMDDWSRRLLRTDLAAAYAARRARRTPAWDPVLGAPALAGRRRRQLERGDLEPALTYWREVLSPVPEPLELAGLGRRPTRPDLRGARLDRRLDAALRDQLVALAPRQRATLFMVLFAAFAATVERLTGRSDFVVAVPTAGRHDPGSDTVVGLVANLLPIRVDTSGAGAFPELVASVRDACLHAYDHQEAPFERIVELLAVPRHGNRRPVAPVAFQLRNLPLAPDRMDDLAVEELDVHPGTTFNDLAVEVTDVAGHLDVTFEYPTSLFDEPAVAAIADAFEATLRAAVTRSPTPVLASQLPDSSAIATPKPEGLVHEWFVQRARAAPAAPAVDAVDAALTYRELDERSNRLAHHLRALGVDADRTVGVLLRRTGELPVTLLAVLKAGGAFLPIDGDHPPARIEAVLTAADPVLVVTERALADRLPPGGRFVVVDDDADAIAAQPAEPCPWRVDGSDLAYVMFTSGSTGRPKGVMVEHGSLASFFAGFAERVGIGERDAVLASTPITFDPAVRELLLPLTLGGRVIVTASPLAVDPAGAAELARDATVVQGTPTTLGRFLDAGWDASEAVTVWSCGERLPSGLTARIVGNARVLWNLYGPTETTQGATAHLVTESSDDVPIGMPLPGYTVEVVGPGLATLPAGVVGELLIGGPGVARGYVGGDDPDASFVTTPAGRAYRSGDLGGRGRDGALRTPRPGDAQVKLRGVRVELGDVEAGLATHPEVREAAADVRGDRLVAWVVPTDSAAVAPADVRRHAAGVLPSALVPSAVAIVDRLPMNANGKLDRSALVEPGDTHAHGAGGPPATPTERALAEAWTELLHPDRPLQRDDDFFLLGGHSLLTIELAHEVQQTFGIELPLTQLFDTPTLESLAAAVDARHGAALDGAAPLVATPAAVRLRAGDGSGLPFFLVPGVWGTVLGLGKSAVLLDPAHDIYGFEAPGHRGGDASVPVEVQAEEFAGEIERLQPDGPVTVSGFSFGGLVAFEVASRLAAGGRAVHLVLVDPRPPTQSDTPRPTTPRRRRPLSKRLRRVVRLLRHPRVRVHEKPAVRAAVRKRPKLRHVIEGNTRSQAQYRCSSRFVGELTLIASQQRSVAAYEEGWRPFVDGPITTRTVPGGHVELLETAESMAAVVGIWNDVLGAAGPRRGERPAAQ